MRRWLFAFVFLFLALPLIAQEPDSDADGVPDSADYCYQVPGTADLYGCPADLLPDIDSDSVPDPLDTCLDQPGLTDNFGCPAGVVPDLDRDGVPDSADSCRGEYAESPDGCLPDIDGDAIPDSIDGCPDQAGAGDNFGCPAGSAPRDSDGDSMPDIFDSCPTLAGAPELNGCIDRDGDNTADDFDQCPDQPGETILFGCIAVKTAAIPAGLPAISTSNAASVREVARLTVGVPRIALASDGALAVRASDNLIVYDLDDPALAPRAEVLTGWAGYPVAATVGLLATFELPADFDQLPYIQVRDATGAPLNRIEATRASENETLGITSLIYHPIVPLLAVAQAPLSGSPLVAAPIRLISARDGAEMLSLPTPGGAINLAFSGDGTRIAGDYAENGTIHVGVWDTGTAMLLASIDTGIAPHFLGTPLALNRDGSLLAIGAPDGSVRVNLIGAGGLAAELARLTLFDSGAQEVVSSVAFSPDGTIVAAAGGVPFSGGLSGAETFPIVLIDVGSAAITARIGSHESLPRDLIFSADGRLLLSAADSSVRFWGAG
ncbi:MAG: WD40 repeat domain-containing protein [Chloroflexota bacterium]|nr:WD40 repeat domain-containing protein [Chloroflexota bacterium]